MSFEEQYPLLQSSEATLAEELLLLPATMMGNESVIRFINHK